MKFPLQRRSGDDVRALWLLAGVVLMFGAYILQTRFERGIGAAHARTESYYRRMVANERVVQESRMLSRVRDAALSDLRNVAPEASLSATTASLVATLDRSASRFHTEVTSVEPGAGAPASSAQPSAEDDALRALPLMLTVHGRFRDLLEFIADLSHHRTLISVSDTQLALANGEAEQAKPALDATIHAILYRPRIPAKTEVFFGTDK